MLTKHWNHLQITTFKSKVHNICTEEVDKIAWSSNDGTYFDKDTSYPYGTNVGNVCKIELLVRFVWKEAYETVIKA